MTFNNNTITLLNHIRGRRCNWRSRTPPIRDYFFSKKSVTMSEEDTTSSPSEKEIKLSFSLQKNLFLIGWLLCGGLTWMMNLNNMGVTLLGG